MVSSLLALLVSGTLIALLGRGDPKRLRNERKAGAGRVAPMAPAMRRLFGWLVPVPGVALMFLGEWWAFLVWLGAICVVGWIASHLLAGVSPRAAGASEH